METEMQKIDFIKTELFEIRLNNSIDTRIIKKWSYDMGINECKDCSQMIDMKYKYCYKCNQQNRQRNAWLDIKSSLCRY